MITAITRRVLISESRLYTPRPKIEHPKLLFSEILAGTQGPAPFRVRMSCGLASRIPPIGTPGFSPGGLHFVDKAQ